MDSCADNPVDITFSGVLSLYEIKWFVDEIHRRHTETSRVLHRNFTGKSGKNQRIGRTDSQKSKGRMRKGAKRNLANFARFLFT